MLMSVAVGEEDRQTLIDIMKNMIRRFVPLTAVMAVCLAACAVPFTRLYYRDAALPVYQMTVQGFRLLPLCMPLSVICMHFVGLNQVFGKQLPVNLLSLLDGVVFVAGFSALLTPAWGLRGVYIANILNGLCLLPVILCYACLHRRRLPETPEHHGIGRPRFGNVRPRAEVVGQQPFLLFAGFARHEPVEQVVYLFVCHHRCLLISSIIRFLAFESVPRTDDSVIPVMAAISAKLISSTLRICSTVRQL